MVTSAPSKTLPPLENGDVLSPDEFWRRYSERHDIKKAELIRGVVYVPSPVGPDHTYAHHVIGVWLGMYTVPRGLFSGDNGSVILPTDDRVQPDLFVFASDTGLDRYRDHVEGVPDLVVEIAASSASYDLHVKKEQYARAGVREYIVWRTWDRAVDWFRLEDGEYQPVVPKDGLIESAIFPGLVLDIDALLREDYATVFQRVQAARESSETDAS